jgi:hypothetical protein
MITPAEGAPTRSGLLQTSDDAAEDGPSELESARQFGADLGAHEFTGSLLSRRAHCGAAFRATALLATALLATALLATALLTAALLTAALLTAALLTAALLAAALLLPALLPALLALHHLSHLLAGSLASDRSHCRTHARGRVIAEQTADVGRSAPGKDQSPSHDEGQGGTRHNGLSLHVSHFESPGVFL